MDQDPLIVVTRAAVVIDKYRKALLAIERKLDDAGAVDSFDSLEHAAMFSQDVARLALGLPRKYIASVTASFKLEDGGS